MVVSFNLKVPPSPDNPIPVNKQDWMMTTPDDEAPCPSQFTSGKTTEAPVAYGLELLNFSDFRVNVCVITVK
jgi:hypothetical protein